MKTLSNLWNFYINGFKSMTYGRTLWLIILIKLFIMFIILKIFFFQDDLKKHGSSEAEKSEYVLEKLTTH